MKNVRGSLAFTIHMPDAHVFANQWVNCLRHLRTNRYENEILYNRNSCCRPAKASIQHTLEDILKQWIKINKMNEKKTLLPLMEGKIAYIYIYTWAVCFPFSSHFCLLSVYSNWKSKTCGQYLVSIAFIRFGFAACNGVHRSHTVYALHSPWKLVFQSSLARFQVASETEHGKKRKNCA